MRIILLLCFLVFRAVAGDATLTRITFSRVHPAFPFSAAAGTHSYYHAASLCDTVTLTIAGDPGTYEVQWIPRLKYSLHGWARVFIDDGGDPDGFVIIPHGNKSVTFVVPAIPDSAGFYQLKAR